MIKSIIRKANKEDVKTIAQCNYYLAYETENKKLDKHILLEGVEGLIEDKSKWIYHICIINKSIVGQ